MPDLKQTIAEITTQSVAELANIKTADEFSQLQTKYLGRKGLLRDLTAQLTGLSNDEKKVVGQQINQLKQTLSALFNDKAGSFQTSAAPQPTGDLFDITLPGTQKTIGHRHPIYETMTDMCNIFKRLGFEIVYGPEIEDEHYNFEALNIPLEHAARDAFDTFYLEAYKDQPNYLLRSHTSPVQIRVMEKNKPPIAIVVPGKVFRPDTPDASHAPMFHQLEGLMVGTELSLANLKGVLDIFFKEMFGPETQMRFRPSYFPFVEPGAEVDISCIFCQGKKSDCSVCKGSGWIELLGAGMVHPNVFKAVGYEPNVYTGFAFGIGVERVTMLKYGINDIRLFTENHLRFLSQF
jgi:phenylalanyl-tRNA synthetase alpha chain